MSQVDLLDQTQPAGPQVPAVDTAMPEDVEGMLAVHMTLLMLDGEPEDVTRWIRGAQLIEQLAELLPDCETPQTWDTARSAWAAIMAGLHTAHIVWKDELHRWGKTEGLLSHLRMLIRRDPVLDLPPVGPAGQRHLVGLGAVLASMVSRGRPKARCGYSRRKGVQSGRRGVAPLCPDCFGITA